MTADPPSVRILMAIADREDVDPVEISEPLYRVIDPDALDRLFRAGTGRVVFEYRGYEVTVDDSGTVEVVPTG